jgi:hypothetical protein
MLAGSLRAVVISEEEQVGVNQTFGLDDGQEYEGVQNNPEVGASLTPVKIEVDDGLVREYINAVGDGAFWGFQARVLACRDLDIAPITLFDRDIGAKLVGFNARFAVHAKQSFKFLRPLTVGRTYDLSGEISEVTTRREVGYFSASTVCAPVDDLSAVSMESVYTRAYRFPQNQYISRTHREPVKLSKWLYSNGARMDAKFPAVGSFVEGRTVYIDNAHVNLYSGPNAGIHTDERIARRAGFDSPVVQGLMATELECELYRDLFGLSFFYGGSVNASYISTIPCNVQLTATAVVARAEKDEIELRAAVAMRNGDVVSVSSVLARDWR